MFDFTQAKATRNKNVTGLSKIVYMSPTLRTSLQGYFPCNAINKSFTYLYLLNIVFEFISWLTKSIQKPNGTASKLPMGHTTSLRVHFNQAHAKDFQLTWNRKIDHKMNPLAGYPSSSASTTHKPNIFPENLSFQQNNPSSTSVTIWTFPLALQPRAIRRQKPSDGGKSRKGKFSHPSAELNFPRRARRNYSCDSRCMRYVLSQLGIDPRACPPR